MDIFNGTQESDESERELEDFVDNLFEEPVCNRCEEIIGDTDESVSCNGKCFRQYHRKCSLELSSNDGKFFCEACEFGGKWCFLCKKPIEDDETFETCSLSYCCRNSFHTSCLKTRQESGKFVCPHHFCATCAIEGKPCTEGQFLACLRCPTAYHKADRCVPAGTFLLNWRWVVCTDHCLNKSNKKSKTNVNFCFICGVAGTLICCETCPCAVHLECVDLKKEPTGCYYCPTCKRNKKPMYGDIVWAKFGSHRWWPAQVVHPMKIPSNLEKYLQEPGEFIVRFYGTQDYGPVTRRNVYPFETEDGCNGQKSSHRYSIKDKRFLAALAEAKQAAQDQHFAQLNDAPNYKPISSNKYHSKVKRALACVDHDASVCSCHVNDTNPCGDDFCENRSTFIECNSKYCMAEEKCRNQRFSRREYAATVKFRTIDRGYGLRLLLPLKKGDFVIEYCGEVINEDECSRRLLQKNSDPDRAFYFLEIAHDKIIDAGCMGEELTFHYNLDTLGLELKTPCKCASPNCHGIIGRINKKSRPSSNGQKEDHKRRKTVPSNGSVKVEPDPLTEGQNDRLKF